jgi:aryl-phospho-beta-D-glucosidase BglC (GH1 family)
MMLKLVSTLIIIVLFLHVTSSASNKFVQIKDNIFVLNGEEYRALGVCLYSAHTANYEYIRRVIIEAKSNGFTLVRIVDIFESEYGKNDDSLTSDRVWKRVDWIIQVCGDNDMKVLLDLSTVRQFLYHSSTRRDSYDPNVYPLWNSIVDFVTNRRNSFTDVVYRDDPTIMSYLIMG